MNIKASDAAACAAIVIGVLGLFVVVAKQAPQEGLAVIAVAGVIALASIALALNERGDDT